MKNMRILHISLIVCILLAAIIFGTPTEVQAATVESGTCGDNLAWILDDKGTLTITGTGPMENYTDTSRAPWAFSNVYIEAVIIGDGVTSIGDYAFEFCLNLTEITIPDRATLPSLHPQNNYCTL